MHHRRSPEHQRLYDYLRRSVPEIEFTLAARLASSDAVVECSRSGNVVSGVVRSDDRTSRLVSIDFSSGSEIIPHCSCQAEAGTLSWCEHAAALALRASALGFFAPRAGFDVQGGATQSWAERLAATIGDLQTAQEPSETDSEIPITRIRLHTNAERLGVQVLFNDVPQSPVLFDEFRTLSGRALDNVLLDLLEEHGVWEADQSCWYVTSTNSLRLILGLLNEFPLVEDADSGRPLTLSASTLDMTIAAKWTAKGAEIHAKWFTNGKEIAHPNGFIGGEPSWAIVDSQIVTVPPALAPLVTLFARSSSGQITASQLGPVLAAITASKNERIQEINPEKRPNAVVATPKVRLELTAVDPGNEHFSSNRQIELSGRLHFYYPQLETPEPGVVYLPDVQQELASERALEELGFFKSEKKGLHVAHERSALNVLSSPYSIFPDDWEIEGLDEIRRGMKFAELELHVKLGQDENAKLKDDMPPEGVPCEVKLMLNGSTVPISTLFKSSTPDTAGWFRFDNGVYARIPGGSLSQLKLILGAVDSNFRLSSSVKTNISSAQAVWLSKVQGGGLAVYAEKSIKKLADKLTNFSGIKAVKPSKNFKGSLRTYQQDALSWLNFLRECSLGGILADEMGLGKTVQTLAFLDQLYSKKMTKHRPSLVVAPTSVIMNWYYEAQRFTPNLKVLVLHGPGRKQHLGRLSDYDIILTSYALLRLNKTDLEQQHFYYLILDEAQYIKNYQAATTAAAKGLRAEHRLALTGTPTENRPAELWSIMDFVMPGYLGSFEFFRTNIERPMLEGELAEEIAGMLRERTRPFLLRRLKAQVEKELPPKIEQVLPVEMTDSQRDLYSRILEEVRPKVFQAVEEKGIRGASVSILAALLRLRQVCNHPNSIEALKNVTGFSSGKFNALKELTEELIGSNRKVLLFCQFKEMLRIIRENLEQQEVRYLYMDGSTKNRQELIDSFNQNDQIRVFLISLKAGGFGINLTAADTVIIYDPWWNPAVENQAIDRAHRIGQTKAVNVYRLVTQESVEQKIMELKKKKTALINALLKESSETVLNISKQDLEGLFAPLPSLGEQ